MNLLRKALVPLAGAAIIVLVLSINGVRAVHAIASFLVENTPTNAVPTVAAPAASQLYSSSCVGFYSGFPGVVLATCNFTAVPAGQTLFIETESIWSVSGHGEDPFFAIVEPNPLVGDPVLVPMVQQAQDVNGNDNFVGTVAGRLWAKAGATPQCFAKIFAPSAFTGEITCTISGYLAPAQ